jgi:hypothetical protein
MKKLVLLLSLLCGGFLHAQSQLPVINAPVFKGVDANGKPLAGGKLWTYVAGSSTPQNTYADAGGSGVNPNPVVLDSSGTAKVFVLKAAYKFILQDAAGNQIYSIDNVNYAPPASPVSSVFGRTGAVTAQSGDYTCGQVTGAVCSLATVYYQNVQVNAGGTAQRQAINFINGTNTTANCVDDAGNNRTNCKFDWVAPTTTPDIWFAFDTCTIAQTGNTYQCGGTFSGSPFPLSSSPTAMVCTPQTPGPVSATFNITQGSLSSSGFSYSFGQYMGNGTSGSAVGAHVYCTIHF